MDSKSEIAKPYISELLIPFPSNHHAVMVMQCMEVDDEFTTKQTVKNY
jgi:hypothetical protein